MVPTEIEFLETKIRLKNWGKLSPHHFTYTCVRSHNSI